MEEEKKHEEHNSEHHVEHHTEHHKTHEHHARKIKKIKKIVMWQGASFLLGVLLILSIVTHGFTCITSCAAADASGSQASGGKQLIILTDERCSDCAEMVSILKPRLAEIFPSFEITELDYSGDDGKQVYEESGIVALPAVLFSGAIEAEPNFGQVEQYLDPAGDYQSLRIGASFDPSAEICTNGKDDNGDGLVDCNDPTCSVKTICREEIKGRLDVFVMSQCPFGTQALDAMKEVIGALGDDIDFHINYIADESSPGVFRSLHGQPEVDENIRELCAIKHYSKGYQYMDYIWCRDKDITSSDWEACAKEAKMSTSIMATCFNGEEGKQLLSENIKLAQSIGVGASPTWMANNKFTFSGIGAETIKSSFCMYNPGLSGCEATLSSDAAVSGQC